MDIKPLLDLTCAKVASMIKGRPDRRSSRHIRFLQSLCARALCRQDTRTNQENVQHQYVHQLETWCQPKVVSFALCMRVWCGVCVCVANDFTPEEEEAVRAENKWAEES
jgi:hypothetical protein